LALFTVYIRTHGQQNTKLMKSFTVFTHSLRIFSRLNATYAIFGTIKVNVHKSSVLNTERTETI